MRERGREIDLEELAGTTVETWYDQNLQRRLAGWNLREELPSKFKGGQLLKFPLRLSWLRT